MNIDIFYNEVIRLKRIKFRKYCINKENKIKELPLIKQGKNIEAVLIEMRNLNHLSFGTCKFWRR